MTTSQRSPHETMQRKVQRFHEQVLMPWGQANRIVLRKGRIQGELGKYDLDFTVAQDGQRLELSLRVVRADGGARPLTYSILSLDLGPRASCTLHSGGSRRRPPERHVWRLGKGSPDDDDPFAELYERSVGFLVGVGTGEEGQSNRPAAQALRDLLAWAEKTALSMCEPHALEAAQAFHPSVAFEVYGLIAAGGVRMAQMAKACPGLLLLLRAMQGDRREDAALLALASIERGEPLGPIIEKAWWAWSLVKASRSKLQERFQRSFVRMAPASVHIPPIAMTILPGTEASDIPSEMAAREAWYRVMVALAMQAACLQVLDDATARKLTGFFSRHALSLSAYATREAKSEEALAAELVDYATRSGDKVPSRRSKPERVWEAVVNWHIATWTILDYRPGTRLPGCVLPAAPSPLKVSALATVGDLQKEGQYMSHCIASYAESAAKGRLFIYKARFREERLTVALEDCGGHLRLFEVRGKHNRSASMGAKDALRAWVDAGKEE